VAPLVVSPQTAPAPLISESPNGAALRHDVSNTRF